MKPKTIKLFKPKINKSYERFFNNADPLLQEKLPKPFKKVIITNIGIRITIKEEKLIPIIEEIREEVRKIFGRTINI